MQRFLIYLFLQTLNMFQAVPPPIIRSTELFIQLQVLSTNTAEGGPPETCRASVEINKLRNIAFSWL